MFYLNVPYQEKDKASGLGAFWDGEKKKWYVPDGVDLEFFKKWISKEDEEKALYIIESQKPEKGIKLSNLLGKVKEAIDNSLNTTYWINAEISNLQQKGSTLYLQLTETDIKGNQICNNRAVIWGSELDFIRKKFTLETGQEIQKGLKVLLKVRVDYSIKHQLSIIVLDIDPQFTLGGMEAKIKQIRDRIVALNLYKRNKKLTLPVYFKKIAVISPEDAAGLGDFKADADKLEKYGICKFKYYTATFQGDKTNLSVSKAIKKASFDSKEEKYDIIVIIRGGGAKTDLHFLNEFDIAKEVAESLVPVFVGVGHERDRVLIDEIGNLSFDTPSKVIAYISNQNINFTKKINKDYSDTMILQEKILKQYKTDLDSHYQRALSMGENVFLKNKETINRSSNKIMELALILKSRYKIEFEEINSLCNMQSITLLRKIQSNLSLSYNQIENEKKSIVSKYKSDFLYLISEISARSPLNALDNGYAIIKKVDGSIITSLEQLNLEKSFVLMMKDGEKELNNIGK